MYLVFVLLVVAQRLAELVVSRRNARWMFAHGGVEYGRGHYPAMVIVHVLLLISCIAEVAVLRRPFLPALGWPMVGLVVASSGVRWWCAAALGQRWNSRVIVIPSAEPLRTGPYRWMRHPNYAAVAVEVTALPLVHTAWLTAGVFTIANVPLLSVRIRTENRALGYWPAE